MKTSLIQNLMFSYFYFIMHGIWKLIHIFLLYKANNVDKPKDKSHHSLLITKFESKQTQFIQTSQRDKISVQYTVISYTAWKN